MSIIQKQLTVSSAPGQYYLAIAAVLLCPPLLIGLMLYYQLPIAQVLGAIILLCLLILMLARPEATTTVVLFVLYANLSVVAVTSYDVPESLASAFFLLLGLPLLNYLIIRRQEIVTNRVLFLMFVYLGVLLISGAASANPAQTISRIRTFLIEGVALYLLIVNTVRTPALLRKGIWALILAGVLMGGISLYQEFTGDYDNTFWGLTTVKESEIDTGEVDAAGEDIQRRRLAGTIGSKNRYGQVMVVLLPLALFRIWAEKSRWLRIVAAASCVPIIGGALLTFSRGAGVSIILTLLAMVFLRTIKLWHFVLIMVLGCLFVYVAIPDYIYRLSTVTGVIELASGNEAEAGGSVRGRATVNLAALNIFLDNPILGVGPGRTQQYTQEYGNEVGFRRLQGTRRAHNMYLEEMADTGIVGFSLFMSIILFTLYRLEQVRRYWLQRQPERAYMAAGFLLAVIAYLFTAIFLHLSYIRYYWLLLALAGVAIHLFYVEVKENGAVNYTVQPNLDA